jgi:hypothetical protein
MCNSNCYNIDANFHVFIGLALLSLLIEFCCWWWWVVGALVDALQDLLSAWASTPNMRSYLQSWNASEPYPCFRARFADNWQGVECLRLSNSALNSCDPNYSDTQFQTRILGLYYSRLSKLYQFLNTIIIEIMIRVKHRC